MACNSFNCIFFIPRPPVNLFLGLSFHLRPFLCQRTRIRPLNRLSKLASDLNLAKFLGVFCYFDHLLEVFLVLRTRFSFTIFKTLVLALIRAILGVNWPSLAHFIGLLVQKRSQPRNLWTKIWQKFCDF